jgi:hypothetical protein
MKNIDNHKLSDTVSVANVMSNAAVALGDVSQILHNLEVDVATNAINQKSSYLSPIVLQDIDLISQSISELQRLLDRMSTQSTFAEQSVSYDVISPIKLEKLRLLIMHGDPSHGADTPQDHDTQTYIFTD